MTVADQTVVVTGGASGIGLAFVERLASLGASVFALDRDARAIQAASTCLARLSRAEFICCDVADESQVAAVVGSIETRGGTTVLVNNAAVLNDQALVAKLGGKIRKHSLADWQETLRCNLTGPFLMTREVAEAMIRGRRRGLIVNVSSISRQGNAGQSAYSAAKAGIDALTVTWARELAPYGIRVAAIAPGVVETPMTRRVPAIFIERLRQQIPVGRFGALEEFAHAIQFVIENDYLHGRVLELDGGLRF